jgi:hypothetical protein
MRFLAKHVATLFRQARLGALAIALLATIGCWDEIHYNPSQEPVKTPSKSVILRSETPRGELAAPAPSADELFAGEEGGETASVRASVAPVPEVEETTVDEDPLWNELSAAEETPAAPEPSPPATIELEEPELKPDPRTALAAWRLASKWSLAVGIYGKGYGADRYGDVWNQAEREADALGVVLPPVPQDVAAEDLAATAATMLLEEAGPDLAAEVGRRHSSQFQVLCDLAIKTHGLLLIYTPDSREVKPLIAAIRRSADDSTLPAEFWTPLVELLDARAEFPDIKRAVFQLHKQAEEHLDQLAAP